MSRQYGSGSQFDSTERKVQIAGDSTYVVSLPKEWAVEQDLDAGMAMHLYPLDDRIVAAPDAISDRACSVTIDAARTDDRTVVQRIRVAYMRGYDQIDVLGVLEGDTETRRAIEDLVNRFIGIEIEERTDDRLSIRDLLDASNISLPETIAQTRQLALEMHVDATTAVRTNDDELAQRVRNRENDVDRLIAFVNRGFHRGIEDVHEIDQLETDRTSAVREYRIGRHLERLAAHAVEIASIASRQSSPPEESVRDRLQTVGSDSRAVVELALAGNTERANETCTETLETITQLDRTLHERGDSDAYLYGMALQRLEQTVHIGSTIAEITTAPILQE